jgi:long-chain acyl-CoA synthetase
VSDLRTLPDLFHAWRTAAHRPALIDARGGTDRVTPAADAARLVAGLAAGLERLGIGRGDRVALLCSNRPEWHIVDFALQHIGAVNVSIYTTLLSAQVAYILEDAGARTVVVENAEQLDKVHRARASLPELREIVLIDGVPPSGVMALADVVQPLAETEVESRLAAWRERVAPQDLATLIYTSGTTGNPKGAMLTQDNFVFDSVSAASVMPWPTGGEVALAVLPLSHVLERLVDYIYFMHGASLAYCGVPELAETLQRIRPHLLTAVPRIYEKIHERILHEVNHASGVKQALFRRAIAVAAASLRTGRRGIAHAVFNALVYKKLRAIFGGRLRFSISGGAPLPQHIAEFFHSVGVKVLEGYGLTETSPVITVNPYDRFRLGTVGVLIPDVEVRIAPDGEILTRGRHVMKGYWNAREATRAAIDPEGWFATGDIGELSPDGYLRITDRKKDIIVTAGGKNVAPQPIEAALAESPLVENAVLFGDRKPYIVALIVPAFEELAAWAREQGIPGAEPVELLAEPRVRALYQGLVDGVNAGLARFETIKKFTLVDAPFTMDGGELTPTLKVKRRVVAHRHKAAIESMYADERVAARA